MTLETREIPKVSSRWVYGGRIVVVHSVTVNWQYENEMDKTYVKHYSGALCVFNGDKPSFTPAPREVKAGQTYKNLYYVGKFKFVVLEVFEGVAYGRQITLGDKDTGRNPNEWYPYHYSVKTLEDTVRWELQ